MMTEIRQFFLAVWLWNPPYGQYALIALAVSLILAWLYVDHVMSRPAARGTAESEKANEIKRSINTRGHKPRRKPIVPFTLGNVTIDLQPGVKDILHTAIGGTSRLGKSTSVIPLYDLPIGVLTIALDDSDPIRDKVRSLADGIEWQSSPNSATGLDLLRGDPLICSEVLVGGFGLVGTGRWQRRARMRVLSALEAMDKHGHQRSIEAVAKALATPIPGESEANKACADWADRLQHLVRTLGPALGPGLDVAESLRQGKKVLLRMNRFLSPMDAPMLGGMLLVHARAIAVEAGVPFILIIEEAGQMANFQDEISPLTQAAGARRVSIVIITQNLSKLPKEVTNNTSVWVSFAQEDEAEMKFAAQKLRPLLAEHFRREEFPNEGRGIAYVRAPGVPTSLVRVARQRLLHTEDEDISVPHCQPEPEVENLPTPVDLKVLPAVPGWVDLENPVHIRAWKKLKYDVGPSLLWHPVTGFTEGEPCLVWTGTPGANRPKMSVPGGTATVYRETFVWAGGVIPEKYELDHLCGNGWCCLPEHMEPVTNAKNLARQTGREKALKARAVEAAA